MTFVGKVLVVLQVVLSLIFMAFAGAVFSVQQSWKAKAATVQAELESNQKTQKDIDDDNTRALDELTKKVVTADNRAKTAEANLKGATDKVKSLERELENQKIVANGLTQNFKIANTEAKERTSESSILRSTNVKLHKTIDKLVSENRVLEEGTFVLSREKSLMLTKHTGIMKELAVAKKIITIEGFDSDLKKYEGKNKPPVNIEGKVLATKKGRRSEPDLIEISLGTDDDLLKGHVLICYSKKGNGKYLGKIRIVYATPDKSVGIVIQKNGIIKEGDYVSPKL